MIQFYDYMRDSIDALNWARSTAAVTSKRTQLESNFAAWASQYTTLHPELLSFYNTVIRPNLPSSVLLNTAQAPAA